VVETVLLPDLQYCFGPACSLVTSYPTPSGMYVFPVWLSFFFFLFFRLESSPFFFRFIIFVWKLANLLLLFTIMLENNSIYWWKIIDRQKMWAYAY
jgi:hypothetical protein